MADSRSSLQIPVEPSLSGRFLPSQATRSEFEFACRLCGGSEFRVDTLRAVVTLNSLQPWQAVGFSDLRGHHSLYTCLRCEDRVRAAQNEAREIILGRLLFAAKDLAMRQFTRSKRELICVECRTPQVAESGLRHAERCTTGRVLTLLQALMSVDDPRNFHLFLDGAAGFASFPASVAGNGGAR